jgi:pimeloyl-ACP methyl ester carboxylesterase
MDTVQSADGTTIAYDRQGSGPALVLVVGAFCNRFTTKDLSAILSADFTVFEYDRRGRGDSTDADHYDIALEVEDLAAIIAAAGGEAAVYGHSSGAALALEGAAAGLPVRSLAVYEPPYTGPDGPTPAFAAELRDLVTSGQREEAARRFIALTGAPPEAIAQVQAAPFWPAMVGLAHTLPYDITLCNDGVPPVGRLTRIAIPTLALYGGASAPWAASTAAAIANAVPQAESQVLDGQNHDVNPEVLAPVLSAYFRSR